MLSAATTSIDRIYDSALALLYPQLCAICAASVESRHDDIACAACWARSRLFTEKDSLCWKCGAVTEASISEDDRISIRCGRCDADNFTVARACGLYEGALRASVLALKREPHVGRRLAQAMIQAYRRAPLADGNL